MARDRQLDDPRRRTLVRMLGLGAMAGGLWVPDAAAQFFGSRPATLAPNRSIYRLVGSVTVNGVAATLDTPIKPGDTVTTGRASECIFVVGGHSMILRESSTLNVERQATTEGAVVRGLRMLTGALLQVSRGSNISVTTRTASIGIRGTGFYVESQPQQTYFCTCYGVTDVAATSDPESRETIAATQHDRPVYVLGDAPRGKNIRNAPFIDHTDQELALIEALVGREPPFVFPKDSYSGPRREY